jgi:hypothetical protein
MSPKKRKSMNNTMVPAKRANSGVSAGEDVEMTDANDAKQTSGLRSGRSHHPVHRYDFESILSHLTLLYEQTRLYNDMNVIVAKYAETGCTVKSFYHEKLCDPYFLPNSLCLLNGRLLIATSLGLFLLLPEGNVAHICDGTLPIPSYSLAISLSNTVAIYTDGRLCTFNIPNDMFLTSNPIIHGRVDFKTAIEYYETDYVDAMCFDFHKDILFTVHNEFNGRSARIDKLELKTNKKTLVRRYMDGYVHALAVYNENLFISNGHGIYKVSSAGDESCLSQMLSQMTQVRAIQILSPTELIVLFSTMILAMNMESGQTRSIAGRDCRGGFYDGIGEHARFCNARSIFLSPDRNTAYVLEGGGGKRHGASRIRILSGLF